jgi:hypothetical protein
VGEVDDALQIFGRDHRAGRIRRRVENDGLGARRDGLSMASAVMRKLSASLVSRKTTLPPAYWMMSLKLTQ